MTNPNATPLETRQGQKNQVDELLKQLETEYLSWYEKSHRRWLVGYVVLQIVTLLLGFASAVIAAFVDAEAFKSWAKATLTALPLVTTLCTAVLTQAKFSEMFRIREEGRLAILELILEGQNGLLKAKTDDEQARLY